jgi:tripartite-type tricarboxylate transporter receptor subunit TctC
MRVLGFAHNRSARTRLGGDGALAMLSGVFGAPAVAADYPSRPIKIVVPYAPGGITDTVARLVADQLAPALGQNVVVENKPGANSIIGADAVAKSPVDGYTLAMVIGAHAANATLYAGKLPFDPVADFAPVSLVGTTPLVMVTSTKLPCGRCASSSTTRRATQAPRRLGARPSGTSSWSSASTPSATRQARRRNS